MAITRGRPTSQKQSAKAPPPIKSPPTREPMNSGRPRPPWPRDEDGTRGTSAAEVLPCDGSRRWSVDACRHPPPPPSAVNAPTTEYITPTHLTRGQCELVRADITTQSGSDKFVTLAVSDSMCDVWGGWMHTNSNAMSVRSTVEMQCRNPCPCSHPSHGVGEPHNGDPLTIVTSAEEKILVRNQDMKLFPSPNIDTYLHF